MKRRTFLAAALTTASAVPLAAQDSLARMATSDH
jgi:hypothetical protein